MNGRAVLFVLGNLLAILGLTLCVPLVVAALYDSGKPDESLELWAFVISAAIAMVLGLTLRTIFRNSADGVRLREGFAIVSFSWVLVAAIGMLPYLLSGTTESITDAFFETMSGLTTTGASVFPEVEVMPHGIMFWRCMTQWLGGMGVVVLGVALLPMLGVSGYRLLKAEAPGGVAYERDRPRITDAAKELWQLYLLFSVVLAILLWILGMTPYDALCHAFTTMSTGGFSSHTESIAYFSSSTIHWVIIVFMFIAGVNFSIHAQWLRGRFGRGLRNPEFLAYTATALGVTAIGVVVLSRDGFSMRIVRDVAFQVVSISTTTGFATADYNLWPHLLRMLLFVLMFVGGSMGSTAGGMKVARLLIYTKVVLRELHRLVYPHAVRPLRVGERVLDRSVVANILAFGFVFIALFVFGSLVMSACGYGLVTSMSATVAALGNIGPGLMMVGPTGNWAHLPDVAKWIMSLLMLMGRLELFSVLILFTQWAWSR